MKSQQIPQDNLNTRAKRNTKRLFTWTILWTLSVALLSFGPKLIWDFNMAFTTIAILSNLALGIKMILVNKDHLAGLDELQRSIQLDAMGMSLGAGLILGVTYETLEDIKVIMFEPEISHLIMAMVAVYIISILLGNRKYA
jgi:uncharacterized membrane protein